MLDRLTLDAEPLEKFRGYHPGSETSGTPDEPTYAFCKGAVRLHPRVLCGASPRSHLSISGDAPVHILNLAEGPIGIHGTSHMPILRDGATYSFGDTESGGC